MIRILRFIFTGRWAVCSHKWKTIKEGSLTNFSGNQVGRWYDQQCEHCGKVKGTET